MNFKKTDARLKQELKHMSKHYKREKRRCARMYPDWRDDEFNMLDNKFIWGYNLTSKVTPSFHSWDDAYVYYNRATRKYYMVIDTGFYGCAYDIDLARTEVGRMLQIDFAFRKFLAENGCSQVHSIFPFNDPALCADSLEGLYFKFRIMLEGYKQFIRQDKIN